MRVLVRILLGAGLIGATTAGAAPPLVHYQGLALDGTGAPITLPVDIEFTIFDQEQSGTPLWNELHMDVQPVDGVFAVILGSLTPLAPELFTQDGRWLGVEIDGEPLEPRQQIASVPWALQAGCTPGDLLLCYSGPAPTLDQGTCAAGRRVCDASGRWGACTGQVDPVAEICGDGLDNDCNGIADDACPPCGDGLLAAGEECDDGNLVGGDGCSPSCRLEVCGNGIWDTGEECDDGNLVDGDGCSSGCVDEAVGQIAPPDANFNDPLDVPLDNTVSVLDFVSFPAGDTQDRVRYQVTGMNPNPVVSGGRARLVISVSCFGQNTDQVDIFTGGQTFACGDTIVDREVTADTDTGTVTITAVGGIGTYVQWVLTGTATRSN